MSVDIKKTEVAPNPDLVTLTIDGIEVSVPKGTLLIRAAEQMGIDIPRFCDHPLLDPVGACRACIVEIPDAGNGRAMKPTSACTQTVMPGMVVETAESNETVAKHQAGMLELILINHPLDCPICDKAGECPLQNQAMSHGPTETRYEGVKRTYPKPINLSAQILLDRERCVLCQRCTRFSEQISGDPYISLIERGARSQISIYDGQPYDSYFSGNVVQICPVGALTSVDYRFQARPFDLVSTTTTCENCAAGCELRVDHRHGSVRRRLAGNNPAVNEEWNCDRGRFGFKYAAGDDRLTVPLVRENGELREASWTEAIDKAVFGLQDATGKAGVLTGGRLTVEAAYAYSRFARAILGTNNIDFRARPIGADEADFLGAVIAGRTLDDSVQYADVEKAKRVLLVGLEPEDECPILFLRLRKAWRKQKLQVSTLAAVKSNGSAKMGASLIETAPGQEAEVLANLPLELDRDSIIFVGERAALSPGALAASVALAERTGAKLAWVPRRAGDVGAIEAGCLPNLLPGGRPVTDASARAQVQESWAVESLPAEVGLDLEAQLQAAKSGQLAAMIVAGVDLRDLDDPVSAKEALQAAKFVISVEQRSSEVTELADVVFPVATIEEQAGSFMNWEHRLSSFQIVSRFNRAPMTDLRLLSVLAEAMGQNLGVNNIAEARDEMQSLGGWDGAKVGFGDGVAFGKAQFEPVPGEGVWLSSWRVLLDQARCVDNDDALVATAPKPVVKMTQNTLESLGLKPGLVEVQDGENSVVRPVEIVEEMCDNVVWTPTLSGKPRKVSLSQAESQVADPDNANPSDAKLSDAKFDDGGVA